MQRKSLRHFDSIDSASSPEMRAYRRELCCTSICLCFFLFQTASHFSKHCMMALLKSAMLFRAFLFHTHRFKESYLHFFLGSVMTRMFQSLRQPLFYCFFCMSEQGHGVSKGNEAFIQKEMRQRQRFESRFPWEMDLRRRKRFLQLSSFFRYSCIN